MSLESIACKLEEHHLTNELIERTYRKERLILYGQSRTAKALITTSLAKKVSNILLIIVPTLEDATRWYPLVKDCGWSKTCLYPTSEASPYDSTNITSEITWGQLQVLGDILDLKENENIAIIATERALQPHLPPIEYLKNKCLKLEVGDDLDVNELSIKLTSAGYIKQNNIDQEGTWSRRGDILDIFPVSSELPIRLEFFGNHLEKIKEFDPLTQRSLDRIDKICITPTGFDPLIIERLLSINDVDISSLFTEAEYDKLINNSTLSSAKKFLGVAFENPATLLDYLDNDTFILIDERQQCISHCNAWYQIVCDSFLENSKRFNDRNSLNIFYKDNLHINTDLIFTNLDKYHGIDTTELGDFSNIDNVFDFSSKVHNWLPNQYGKISLSINDYIKDNVSVWIISAQPSRAVSLLEEHECFSKFIVNNKDINGIMSTIKDKLPVAIKNGNDGEIDGFFLPAWKIALISDKEFFGQSNIISTGN